MAPATSFSDRTDAGPRSVVSFSEPSLIPEKAIMRYVDRDMRPLNQEQWASLYRDPGYATLARLDIGDPPRRRFEASWIGVILDCERTPAPFLVQSFVADGDGALKADGEPTWHGSQGDALDAARKLHEAARPVTHPRRGR